LLAGSDRRYSGFHRHDIPYTRAAESRFRPFARHPVVEAYERLAAKGLDPVFFSAFIFSLGDPPALEPREPFEPGNLAEAGGAEALEEFRILLADFARVSRFAAFFGETEPLRRHDEEERALDARPSAHRRRCASTLDPLPFAVARQHGRATSPAAAVCQPLRA
jgi:hypothetical protein